MEISVIIPALDEELLVSKAIESAWQCGADEVIVVDGGSVDSTLKIANALNCKIVECAPSRGRQLNEGARVAQGSVFVFLHADSLLPPNACQQIKACIQSGQYAGAFQQRIDSDRLIFRLIEFGNALRVRCFQMAYGDQGIFVSRELFEKLGGFDNISYMEDFCFSKKLKKSNRYALLAGPLVVNARHWEKRGPLTQTLKNWSTIFRFLRGARPAPSPTSVQDDHEVVPVHRAADKIVD